MGALFKEATGTPDILTVPIITGTPSLEKAPYRKMASVSLFYILPGLTAKLKQSFQKTQRKTFSEAIGNFDPEKAEACDWELAEYAKIHGGGSSQMEGYCLATMKGNDGKYHAALFATYQKKITGFPLSGRKSPPWWKLHNL